MARSGSVAHLLVSLTRSGESMASAGQKQAMQNILSSKLQSEAKDDNVFQEIGKNSIELIFLKKEHFKIQMY